MTIAQELIAANELCSTLATDNKVQLEALGKANAEIVSMKAVIEKLTVEAKAFAEAQAKVIADAQAVLIAEQTAHAADKLELDKAKAALANPAFAAAAATGSKKAVGEGRSEAQSTEEMVTKENAEAKYRQLPNAQAKAEFRAQYGKELGLVK
jgi:hypothetical protein